MSNERLVEMLSYCRPMGSRAESKFRNRYIRPLGAREDEWGNLHVQVGKDSPILWSCHTDTVHRAQGRQEVIVTETGYAQLRWQKTKWAQNCLGADDTVGVYLMCEMIKAGVPGDYVFHYGEEKGGVGARALAKHLPDWVGGHQFAIALDRAGTDDIITHQGWGRTASDAFAEQLGGLIEVLDPELTMRGCHGVYTDTAEYEDLIPECTNLSVGYQWQHSSDERVDLYFVERLRAVLIGLDWTVLKASRDPKVVDNDWGYGGSGKWEYSSGGWKYWTGHDGFDTLPDWPLNDPRWDAYDRLSDECYSDQTISDAIVRLERAHEADDERLLNLDGFDPDAQAIMRQCFDEWQEAERAERQFSVKLLEGGKS